MILRDYQHAAVDALFAYWQQRRGVAPLAVAPTGSGKSLILASFMQRALAEYPGTRILLATHQRELIRQDYQTLHRLWPNAPTGIYSAGLGRRQARAQLLFAGVQSIHRKAEAIGHVDLMGIDEAHLLPRNADTQYGRLIAGLREINPAMKIFGLTATPYRLDSGLLHRGEGAIFDGIAYDIPVAMLVQQGHLAPLVSKQPGQVFDLRGLHTRAGDFIEREMMERFGTDEATRSAVAEIVQRGADRRSWIAFCIGVDHAHRVRDEMRRLGIVAEAVTGDMPSADRDRILSAYKAGRIRCLTSVAVLTTGFDAPATDLLAFLRPTQSTGLYVQMAGRGMRTAPGKVDCLALDFARNVALHGPVDAIALPSEKPGKGDGEKIQGAPTKVCPNCGEIVHLATRECADCGFEFPTPEKIDAVAGTEAIMNLTAAEHWHPVRAVDYSCHRKHGSPDSMRVEYLVDGRSVSEWVCLEHGGFARQKAVRWWEQWAGTSIPSTTTDALARVSEITRPAEAVLRREGKYYRIVRMRAAPAIGREDAA
jgi:DNA repair protein RadD